jgi:DNA-directed RNA polymerase subunit RPC12/RpoP
VLGRSKRADMSSASRAVCPRCGSTDLDLESASLNGETADETTVQRCRNCGERFSITAKRD